MTQRTVADGGVITDAVKIAVWKRDDKKCRECHNELVAGVNAHYDHIIPWSRGGGSGVDNVQLLCKTCNLRKGATVLACELELLRPTRPTCAVDLLGWLSWHQEWAARLDRHMHDTLIPWLRAHPETEPQVAWQMVQDLKQWVNAATMEAWKNRDFAPVQEYAQKCRELSVVGKDGRQVRVLEVVPDLP